MNIRNRLLYGLSALSLTGVLIELIVSINREESAFESGFERGINLFAFFTIWSNLIVAITSFMVARNDRNRGQLFWGIWLAGLGGIVLTFIIQHLFLSGPLSGLPLVSDTIIHTIVPTLALATWFFYGPRRKITMETVLISSIVPNFWILLTFTRGALTDWYPYEFLDVNREGAAQAGLNQLVIYAMLYTIIAVMWWLEARGPLRSRRQK